MPSQAAKRSLAKAGSRGSSSGSIAPGWLTPWLVISGVLVVWDAGYVLMRPRSMPGGDLFWLWRPYPLYASVSQLRTHTRDGAAKPACAHCVCAACAFESFPGTCELACTRCMWVRYASLHALGVGGSVMRACMHSVLVGPLCELACVRCLWVHYASLHAFGVCGFTMHVFTMDVSIVHACCTNRTCMHAAQIARACMLHKI
eukprot:366307-Chlamydomonas_euryale.AAC.1